MSSSDKRSVYDPPTMYAELPTPRRLAANGYIAYLAKGGPSNAYGTRAGWGKTPTEAIRASLYWANQMPWVRVVCADKAPLWAQEAIRESANTGDVSK